MFLSKSLQTKYIFYCLLLMFTSLVLPGFAFSDESKDDIVVVITANKGEGKDILDIPQSISKIDREYIDNSVYSDLDDVLRIMPNIKMANSVSGHGQGNTQGNYWQEGFSIRGLGNQRALVLNDNVRQSGQGVGYGGGNLSLYDPMSIESVEVLRGPSSVLYGTDAIAGVVNVITRNPVRRTEPGGNMGLRYAFDQAREMNRISGYADVGNEDFGLVFGWTFADFDEPKLANGKHATDGSYRQGGGWLKGDYYLSEDNKIRIIANQNRSDDILVKNTSDSAAIRFFIPTYERSNIGTELEFKEASENIDLVKLGFYWQGVNREFERTAPNFMGGPPTTVKVVTDDKVNTFEFGPQVHFNLDPHKLIVGADIALDTVKGRENQKVFNNSGTLTSSTDRLRVDASQYRLGFFAQDTWELYPFELILGGRFDQFFIKNDRNPADKHDPCGISGSIGLVYHYSETFSYYANVATGFRVPDLSERYQDTIVTVHVPVTVTGNPNLKPERSYSFELGTKSRFEWVSYEFAVFATQIDDFIGAKESGFTQTFQNQGGIFLYGYEGGVSMNPYEPWIIYVNLARTYTKEILTVPMPRWTINYGTSYRIDAMYSVVKSITPEIRGRTQERSFDAINSQQYKGFTVFDVQVAIDLDLVYKDSTGKWIIGVKNILNEEYKEPFFNELQPHRSIFTSFQLEF